LAVVVCYQLLEQVPQIKDKDLALTVNLWPGLGSFRSRCNRLRIGDYLCCISLLQCSKCVFICS